MNIRPLFTRILIVVFFLIGIYLFLRLPQLYRLLWRGEQSINVLAWPTVLSRKTVQGFEKRTGYRVNVTYFENYEEVTVKLRAGKGAGYDIVAASDYVFQHLIQDGLLKKIDKTKLPFARIYPQLLHSYFDTSNDYTIPYVWDIYGIGINRFAYVGEPDASWGILFRPPAGNKVGMLDDAREVVLTAAQYLFGSIEGLTDSALSQIKDLLIAQRPHVAMFTDMRVDYLLSSQLVSAAMVVRSDIADLMLERKEIDFLLPREGGFKVIDSLALSAATTKNEILYEFINYLYEDAVYSNNIQTFGNFSVLPGVPSREGIFVITPTEPIFKQLSFFKNTVPHDALTSIWIDVKA